MSLICYLKIIFSAFLKQMVTPTVVAPLLEHVNPKRKMEKPSNKLNKIIKNCFPILVKIQDELHISLQHPTQTTF